MKESKFNKEVVDSFKSAGLWAKKLNDFPPAVNMTLKFSPDIGADIIASSPMGTLIIEGKLMKGAYKGLGLYDFRQKKNERKSKQLEDLDQAVDCPFAKAYVFINVRANYMDDCGRMNRLIILRWADIRDRLYANDSIKKKEMEQMPYFEGKKGQFPLRDIIEYIKKLEINSLV